MSRLPRQASSWLKRTRSGHDQRPPTLANEDLAVEVAGWLTPSDLISLIVTCKHLRNVLESMLYRSVNLDLTNVDAVLQHLISTPRIARCVRSLSLHLNNGKMFFGAEATQMAAEEFKVSRAIQKLAPNLISLQAFEWDAVEGPEDELWVTLQTHCPDLRDIGTSMGIVSFSDSSTLFNFRDLLGFSLKKTTSQHIGTWFDYMSHTGDAFAHYPQRLWDMLVVDSPNLRRLSFDGDGSGRKIHDLSPLNDAHWPNLRKLCFGEIDYWQDMEVLLNDLNMHDFLARHDTLQHVVLRRLMEPSRELPRMKSITSFEGFMPLFSMPALRQFESIQALVLVDLDLDQWLPVNGRTALDVFCAGLRELPLLTALTLGANVYATEQLKTMLTRVMWSCAALEYLELTCRTRTSFPIRHILDPLSFCKHLRKIQITKSTHWGDHSGRCAAALIAAQRIKQIHSSGLAIELTYTKYSPRHKWRNMRSAPEKRGTYVVSSDPSNVSDSVVMHFREWRRKKKRLVVVGEGATHLHQ